MWNNIPDDGTSRLDREYESFLRQYGASGQNNQQRTFFPPGNDRKRSLASSIIGEDDFRCAPGAPRHISTAQKLNLEAGLDEDESSVFSFPAKKLRKAAYSPAHPEGGGTGKSSNIKDEEECDSLKLELAHSKAEVATLKTKVNRLERDLVEVEANWERRQQEQQLTKQKLERKVGKLEQENCSLREKEERSRNDAEEHKRAVETHQLKMSTDMESVLEDRRKSLDNFANLEANSRKELEGLRMELSAEKMQSCELREKLAHHQTQIGSIKQRNVELLTQAHQAEEEKLDFERKARDASLALTQYQEDNNKAMAMREEMLAFCELKTKYQTLAADCHRYKLKSENTALLQERVYELEQQLKRLKTSHDHVVAENNELKITISKSSSVNEKDTTSSGLQLIDRLTVELTDTKQENRDLLAQLQDVQSRLHESEQTIDELEKSFAERYEGYNAKLEEQQECIDSLRAKCEEEKENEIHMEERLEEAKWKLDLAENELQERENELNDWKGKVACLEELRTPEAQPSTSAASETEVLLRQEIAGKEEIIEGLKERLHMKGDFDPAATKVVHMEFNPLEEAHQEYKKELETLKEEHSRVRTRLEELEKEREKWQQEERGEDLDLTSRVEFRQKEEKAKEEIASLKNQIRQVEKEKQRVNETHAQIGRQYREMCTLLTGYQCKMRDQEHYQVQSIYENEPEKSFLFKKSADNLQLLESDYTPEWSGFVETYLETDGCIPAFLAAVTLQLYDRRQQENSATPTKDSR